MSIGKQEESQGTLWLSYDQLPKSTGHAFYDHPQVILVKGRFDCFAEKLCEPFYTKEKDRPPFAVILRQAPFSLGGQGQRDMMIEPV